MSANGLRALTIVLLAALAYVLPLPARAAAGIELPQHGTVQLLPLTDVAPGDTSAGDVLAGRAAFRPYSPAALAGWPVDLWLRFTVHASRGERPWLIQLPETELAELYAPSALGYAPVQRTGTALPFTMRSAPYLVPSFSFDPSAAGTAPIYLHVRFHPDLPFAPILRDSQTFFAATTLKRLVHGLFLGVLLAVASFNIYVFLALRDRTAGFFVLYTAALAFNELVTTGIGAEYLWPALGGDPRLAVLASNTLAFGTFLAFARIFLETRLSMPRLDRAIVAIFAVQVAVAILEYATPLGASLVYPLLAIELLGMTVMAAIGINRWRQGYGPAAFFSIAYIPAAVGVFLNIFYDATLPAGNWFWASNGVELGVMLQCIVVTFSILDRLRVLDLERRIAERALSRQEARVIELRRIAMSDPLTGLANRLSFYDCLETAIRIAERTGEVVGTLFVDLDDFKLVNDRFGHRVGDQLLQNIARRLSGMARDQDVVARLGGDEFAMLLRNVPSEATLLRLRDRVAESLADARIDASIGSSVFPRDGNNASELVDAADRSMYADKQRRKAQALQRSGS
jgi:diguanylate cyclase (GGDEF)-like protein